MVCQEDAMLYLGGELLNDLLCGHHVEGPGLLRVGDDLAGRQQEAVTPGVPQLDTASMDNVRELYIQF